MKGSEKGFAVQCVGHRSVHHALSTVSMFLRELGVASNSK